jgi:hypothetical protein
MLCFHLCCLPTAFQLQATIYNYSSVYMFSIWRRRLVAAANDRPDVLLVGATCRDSEEEDSDVMWPHEFARRLRKSCQ